LHPRVRSREPLFASATIAFVAKAAPFWDIGTLTWKTCQFIGPRSHEGFGIAFICQHYVNKLQFGTYSPGRCRKTSKISQLVCRGSSLHALHHVGCLRKTSAKSNHRDSGFRIQANMKYRKSDEIRSGTQRGAKNAKPRETLVIWDD
jgi:hypothetical protein